jgi:glycosyltransferase involved in cell wall biosynthesis
MAKVRALGLTESVRFLGRQDEVAEVISLADLLLLPSEKESFGLVALEAMACGVPTVGAHTGGIPELIEHGVNGFVAPIGEISTMAQYAVRMLTEDGLHASMRENGLARVRERFSGSIAAAHYESLYEKALRGGGSLDG